MSLGILVLMLGSDMVLAQTTQSLGKLSPIRYSTSLLVFTPLGTGCEAFLSDVAWLLLELGSGQDKDKDVPELGLAGFLSSM